MWDIYRVPRYLVYFQYHKKIGTRKYPTLLCGTLPQIMVLSVGYLHILYRLDKYPTLLCGICFIIVVLVLRVLGFMLLFERVPNLF